MKQHVPRVMPVSRPPTASWVPPAQRDTAWWIFYRLFRCRLKRILTIPLEEMQEVGTPTSFDPDVDRQMQNERVERMLSIVQMAHLWGEGVSIGLVDPRDATEIYERLSNHLYAWKDKLENEVNTRNAPLEDLVKLDAFANVVYALARYQFPRDYMDSRFERKARSLFAFTGESLLKPLKPAPTPVNQVTGEEDPGEQRLSLADAFVRGRPSPASALRWK
ncbi:hypothetical protein [Paraburkholderia adhaesiva]|uniref:hypothetical protein n=1 Tax=Paraburkholderia adhaesiva TaxID=2883244 RepID=UPI001F405FFF|nr:hypothetical protein [Paraburkholderia adhaesiva]